MWRRSRREEKCAESVAPTKLLYRALRRGQSGIVWGALSLGRGSRYASAVRLKPELVSFVGFAGVAVAFVACGGTVQDGNAVTSNGSGAASGAGGTSNARVDSGLVGAGGAFVSDAGLTDVRYVDPGCAPAMKVQGRHACNPFAQSDEECGLGYRCVPYVRYANQCKTEEIGTECEVAGTGQQGDDCTVAECAAGFVCVTAGSGFQCAALCQLTATGDTCTSGLICTPLDVDGYYVCG